MKNVLYTIMNRRPIQCIRLTSENSYGYLHNTMNVEVRQDIQNEFLKKTSRRFKQALFNFSSNFRTILDKNCDKISTSLISKCLSLQLMVTLKNGWGPQI